MAGLSWRQRLYLVTRAAVGTIEVEPGTVGHSLLSGIFPGAIGTPPQRGTREHLQAYSTMPWLRAVAARVSSSVASTEWAVCVPQRANGRATRIKTLQRAPFAQRQRLLKDMHDRGELRHIRDHPLLDLLDSANPYQTGLSMRKITQLHLDLVGEAFWLKERNGAGMPTGVWPIPPDWVVNTPTPANRAFRVSFRGWRGDIPDTEMLWFVDPNPENPYARGSGTARALSDELETDEYAAKMLKQMFFNRARPDFIAWPKGEQAYMSAPELRRVQETWLAEHQGFWRAARPHFASREIGVHEFQQDNRKLQLSQLRQDERDIIIHVFGLPPEMLGIIERSNRATIEAADFLFARWVLVPRLEFLRTVIQERLIPEFDERLVLDFVSPIEEDREFALKAMEAAPWAPTVDQWLQRQGLPGLENGKGQIHMVPFQLQPVADLGAAIPPPTPPARAVGESDGWPDADKTGLKADAALFRKAGDAEGERACLKALADDLDDLPPLVRLASRLEPEMRRGFLRAVQAAKGRIDEAALAEALRAGNMARIEELLQLPGFAAALRGGVGPPLNRGFLAGAEFAHDGLAAAGLTMRFDLVNPHAQTWVERHGAIRVTEIVADQQNTIREIVQSAFTEGRDVRRTARSIRGVVGLHSRQARAVENFRARLVAEGLTGDRLEKRVARYAEAQLRLRSRNIARTEILRASSEGQRALWGEAKAQGLLNPATTRRRWLVTPDDRLDLAICERMDQVDVPLDEPWTLPDGRQVMVPQESHPQCRCSAALEFKRSGGQNEP